MKVSLLATFEKPLFGIGFGVFNYLFRHVNFNFPDNLIQFGGHNASPHNLYFAVMVEVGIPALLCLGIFGIQLFRLLFNLDRHTSLLTHRNQQWWLIQYMFGCITAILVTQIFTNGFFYLSLWILVAFIINASSIVSNQIETYTETF